METTAGILRQFHELGRGGALRRVLTRVTETFVRQGQGPGPGPASAFTSRHHPWGDVFWEATPRHAGVRPAAAPAAKPHDLFQWLEDVERAAPAAAPVAPPSRAERLAKRTAAAGVRRVRSTGRPSMYSEQRRTVAGEAIARLLEVNRSVAGVRGAPPVNLPRSRFAARVDLWAGRPIGNPFVMGN